jgi:predicted  nucleic acid-binding Zn-ribbon protein
MDVHERRPPDMDAERLRRELYEARRRENGLKCEVADLLALVERLRGTLRTLRSPVVSAW